MRCFVLLVAFSSLSFTPLRAEPEKPTFKLVSQAREDNFRDMLPKTTDPDFEALKKKPLVFYTESDVPPAYQKWDGREGAYMAGLHDVHYNISGDRSERRSGFGNANREFPWGTPAGLHLTTNASNFKFVYLPSAIQVIQKHLHAPRLGLERFPSYVWTYPEGTVFGEVLGVTNAEGYSYTFEVRTRTKSKGAWSPNVYRPFPTHKDLTTAVAKIVEGNPEWTSYRDVVAKPATPPENKRLADTDNPNPRLGHPTLQVVNVEATEWEVGNLPQLMVQRLLKRTEFRKDFGEDWVAGEHYAVTTQSDFNIVPKNYKGGYFRVTKGTCATCHDNTLKHADEFDVQRDWYGRVRGSDAIISFHPFALSSIAPGGIGRPIAYRQELLDAGLIKESK